MAGGDDDGGQSAHHLRPSAVRRDGRVLDFIEKPDTAKNLINGGFFVLEPRVFDIISDVTDATVMWEQGPLGS
jgi:glucose-1-phosphate cytidylyltransferase